MSQKRKIKDNYVDYENALKRLDEALREDLSVNKMAVDGTIQRFEFTFELAWKLAKRVLEYMGVEVKLPRLVIKEAFQKDIINNGDGWLEMLEDRNKTTHIYDEAQALQIYKNIQGSYYPLFRELQKKMAELLKDIKD